MKRCAACTVLYCSAECQRDDWKHGPHKTECKLRAAARAESHVTKVYGLRPGEHSRAGARGTGAVRRRAGRLDDGGGA